MSEEYSEYKGMYARVHKFYVDARAEVLSQEEPILKGVKMPMEDARIIARREFEEVIREAVDAELEWRDENRGRRRSYIPGGELGGRK